MSKRRETDIRVRVNAEEKRILDERAAARGLKTSPWLRSLGLSAAIDNFTAPPKKGGAR